MTQMARIEMDACADYLSMSDDAPSAKQISHNTRYLLPATYQPNSICAICVIRG